MNQDKIGKFIKESRTKDRLSQQKFGEKYGVTYQAVSKWENGKNLPDISILKEICRDYNKDINELLTENKKSINKFIIIPIILIIIIFIIVIFKIFNSSDFNFKTIKTTCDNFDLYGSIAYNKNKTSIYISNITYCGIDKDKKYKQINCSLYESDKDTKKIIKSFNYDDEPIILDQFLDQIHFNIDHYSKTCKMYKDNGLTLEIKAIDENDQTIFFNVPLVFEKNCN